jgi:hypothetical protein
MWIPNPNIKKQKSLFTLFDFLQFEVRQTHYCNRDNYITLHHNRPTIFYSDSFSWGGEGVIKSRYSLGVS